MPTKSVLYITVTSDSGRPAQTLKETLCKAYDKPEVAVNAIAAHLERLVGGSASAIVHVALAGADTGTAGTGTIACVQASAAAGDTVTIGETKFTVATSPSPNPQDGQFSRGSTNTDTAVNLAAAINNHPAMKGSWIASNVAGTLTLTAVSKGVHANLINITTSKPAAFTITGVTNGAKGTLLAELRSYRLGQ